MRRAADLVAHHLATVHARHESGHVQGIALDMRIGAEGHGTAAGKRAAHRALGLDAGGGAGMVERRQPGPHIIAIRADFDA